MKNKGEDNQPSVLRCSLPRVYIKPLRGIGLISNQSQLQDETNERQALLADAFLHYIASMSWLGVVKFEKKMIYRACNSDWAVKAEDPRGRTTMACIKIIHNINVDTRIKEAASKACPYFPFSPMSHHHHHHHQNI
jgi:hypothetical protein